MKTRLVFYSALAVLSAVVLIPACIDANKPRPPITIDVGDPATPPPGKVVSNPPAATSQRQVERSAESSAWYQGGTLHNATIAEWRNATNENRLATSADMMAATLKSEGRKLSSFDELLPLAQNLERCISIAGESEAVRSQDVAGLAVPCILLMEKQ
jgi:hypothetical protein